MAQLLKITISYDGRPYDGWQSQSNGGGVQDHLQVAASAIAKSPIQMHGAGRTDAGVHALGQVAHFELPEGNSMTANDWQRALHTKLPPTIRVVEAIEVSEDFHSRYTAKNKTYRYEIDTGKIHSPLRVGLAWHIYYPMDVDVLREAVGLFQGELDFAKLSAKRKNGKPVRTSIRTIKHAGLTEREDGGFSITFTGDGFLYKMVRMMVGAAVDCARGRKDTDWIRSMLENDPRIDKCSSCAPADGLYLVGVEY